MRILLSAFALAIFLAPPAAAGDDGLKGRWKLTVFVEGRLITFWLVHLESKDGKISASAEQLKGTPKATVSDVKLVDDRFQMRFRSTIRTMAGPEEVVFDFEGKLPKPGAKKIFGSLSQEGTVVPAVLEATTAVNAFELDRDLVTRTPNDPRAFTAIFDLIEAAKENKASAKDVQEWVDASLKAADNFGPRFVLKHNLAMLEVLAAQKGYAAVTVETARKISKQMDTKAPVQTQLEVQLAVASAFRSANAKDDATALEARIEKLEGPAHADYEKKSIPFKLDKFAGRKAKSTRAVLVELFTGAQCPPCVAADMAFDGLARTYPGKDVVLLQYHMHIPRPEPMSNPDSDIRFDYYAETFGKAVGGTPALIINGKPLAKVGGPRELAEERYKEFTEAVNKTLEAPARCTLSAAATRSGDKISVTAKVTDLDKAGDKVRVRFALVEDWVRYEGTNRLPYHHRVVRATPGGPRGFAAKGKESDHTASIDLTELRKSLNKYLDDSFEGPRPMRLRDLRVVAFVQDDESAEVLQAIEVPVREK